MRGARRRVALLRRRGQARGARQHVGGGAARRAQSPQLNPSFAEYAQARGFFVDPARVRRPQDKARVENQVPYVRERWFAGESFGDDLDVLRATAEQWCREVAGARVHGTTRLVPREVFEEQERAHLLPAPTGRFDVPRWSDRQGASRSPRAGRPLAVLGADARIWAGRCACGSTAPWCACTWASELVKMHARVAPGKRSTDPDDYPVGQGTVRAAQRRGARRSRSRARRARRHLRRAAARRTLAVDQDAPGVRASPAVRALRRRARRGAVRARARLRRDRRAAHRAHAQGRAQRRGRCVPAVVSSRCRRAASRATLRRFATRAPREVSDGRPHHQPRAASTR